MIKRILFLALAAVLMTACAFSLPGKFTQLADKVAAKGADFTPAQWEKANAQFEKLVNQYVDKYDKLSTRTRKKSTPPSASTRLPPSNAASPTA